MDMYRILLADDEQIERMALAKRLKRNFGDSLAISEAVDGKEALEVFGREKSQIVIMDISMPEMNGAEAAEQIRRMDEDCVIIFLTAYDDFAYAKRAIVIRALDYLLKPCDEEELVAVMEEAMRLTDRREKGKQEHRAEKGQDWAGIRNEVDGQSAAGSRSGAGGQDAAGSRSEAGGRDAADNQSAKEVQAAADEEYTGAAGIEECSSGRMAQAAQTMREYVRNNYMKEISMQDAARMMNYSDAYFCKLFKQCFDQNFTSYLTNFRVNEAKRLLMNPNVSVKDVGMQVGYYDSNYFAKVFKRITGMIPSEYRDSLRK